MKDEMIDNRKVHSTRQKGIERVLQRKEDRRDVEGHHGYMQGHKPQDMNHWKRKGDSLTPRKA